MIQPDRYVVTCDAHRVGHPDCPRALRESSYRTVMTFAREQGWAISVRKDGAPSKTQRLDFCPNHIPEPSTR